MVKVLAAVSAVTMMIAGCHIGAGPVIAISSTHGLRAGLEASGGLGFVRGSIGNTWALGGQPSRFYVTGEPGYLHQVSSTTGSSPVRKMLAGGGLTIGKAWGDDDKGVAFGAWASGGVFYDKQTCQDGYLMYSIAFGLRDLAGVGEFFIAPKLSAFSVPAPC